MQRTKNLFDGQFVVFPSHHDDQDTPMVEALSASVSRKTVCGAEPSLIWGGVAVFAWEGLLENLALELEQWAELPAFSLWPSCTGQNRPLGTHRKTTCFVKHTEINVQVERMLSKAEDDALFTAKWYTRLGQASNYQTSYWWLMKLYQSSKKKKRQNLNQCSKGAERRSEWAREPETSWKRRAVSC